MARLVIRSGAEKKVFELDRTDTTIGRGPANSVFINDGKLSRNHCLITMTEDGYLLEDLGSHNGTYVNHKRIKKRYLLDGDEILLGSTRVIFENSPETVTIVAEATDSLSDPSAKTEEHTLSQDQIAEAANPFESAQIQRLQRENRVLIKLQEINKAITSERDLDALLTLVVDSAVGLMNATRGFLAVIEDGKLEWKISRGADKQDLKKVDISLSIVREVAETGKPILASNAKEDDRFREFVSVAGLGLSSIISVPLKVTGQILGVIYLDNPKEKGTFSREDLNLLSSFGNQAAIAIDNAKLLKANAQKTEELRQQKDRVEKLNYLLEEKMHRQEEELEEVREEIKEKRVELKLKYNYENIIGKSQPMQELYRILDKVTDSQFPVLVEGESGTGKEMVAKAIHYNGPRKDSRFVGENVSAISPSLLESEMFGHVRGAFTGATRDKKGLFELAHKGTLFLDEIGEMDLEMQKKLLRALQEGEIRRVGGKDVIKVDVRIISATNKDLKRMVSEGKFREDLYYRLNVFNIRMPALRERRDDIVLLVDHFLNIIHKNTGKVVPKVPSDVMRSLSNYAWPGNVRELQNEVEKLVALADDVITMDDLSVHIRKAEPSSALRGASSAGAQGEYSLIGKTLRDIEHDAILQNLQENGFKKIETAKVLGIPRKTLYNKMKRYGIEE